MRQRLLEACAPEAVYLFGSVARGDAAPESDLDVLVVATPSEGETKNDVSRRARAALRDEPTPMDLIVMTPEQFAR